MGSGDILRVLFALEGKVALVTGAAVGHGRAIATGLQAAGATVLFVDDLVHAGRLKDVAVNAGKSTSAVADVRDPSAVEALFERLAREHGKLDILVNALVENHNRNLLEIEPEEWDRVQATNLKSAFLMTKAAVPLMRLAGGGRVINVTTIGSMHPVLNGNGAYSSSRAGLNAFTRNCALDFAADKINVNAILPGAIITEVIDTSAKRTGPGADPARYPGGYGRSEDLVGATLLLAGPGGSYISGQLLAVDGGFQVA
jgi:NAD(P)-dependent dehydrogenase (short-subunit alcohol dehydrogenase family)